MNSKVTSYFLLFLTLLLVSCTNSDFDCLTSAGPVTKEFRGDHEISSIEIYDDINLILTQDTLSPGIIVETGENLLENIETIIDKDHLTLRNNTTCNWTRSFETQFNVFVNLITLDTLIYRGSGNVLSTDTLYCDSLQLDIWEGAGSIELILNSGKTRLYNHQGTVDLTVRGRSGITFISSKGYGPINCSHLDSDIVYMYSLSPNDCYVHSRSILDVTIDNIGNIYYTGDPYSILTVYNSTGRLIKTD